MGCAEPLAPIAAIAGPMMAYVGNEAILDGSGSTAPDGRDLTFSWRLVSVPENSLVAFDDPTLVAPALVPDRAGTYVIELVVATTELGSEPASHTITVTDRPSDAGAGDGGPADGGFMDGGIGDGGSTDSGNDAASADGSSDAASSCGAADQPCCAGPMECDLGLRCEGSAIRTCIAADSGTIACGGLGQGCCGVPPPGLPCDPGLECVGTLADAMCVVPSDAGPVACGMNGELCCTSMPYCVTGLTCRSHLPLPSRCAP